MKSPLPFVILMLSSVMIGAAEQRGVSNQGKSVVDVVRVIGGHGSVNWTLYHFRELNSELARFVSKERGMNSKCMVVPDAVGYSLVWIRSDWEDPVTEEQKKRAKAIIDSFLSGKDARRITQELNEKKEPNQAAEPTAPSGRGSP
jgi:hypothetical protein